MYYPGEIKDHRVECSFLRFVKIQYFVSKLNFVCQIKAIYTVNTLAWEILKSCMAWSPEVYITRYQLIWAEYLVDEVSLSPWRKVLFAPCLLHPGSYYGGSRINVVLFPSYNVHNFWAILHCTEVVGTFKRVGRYAWLGYLFRKSKHLYHLILITPGKPWLKKKSSIDLSSHPTEKMLEGKKYCFSHFFNIMAIINLNTFCNHPG